MSGKILIFTDLDGTLLNRDTFEFGTIKKYIKYFFYAAFILALKEWADFLRGDDWDILRLIGNTALAFYFWGLSVGKFEFRE